MDRPPRRPVSAWLAARLDLEGLAVAARSKLVPLHRHAAWTFLGGVLLFLFAFQAATGILLMVYYHPTAAEAHESVARIVAQVPFGWLVRSLHAWGAHFMVFALLAHFFSTLFLRAYRKPRELTWVTGMLLLGLTLALGFSGYLLPWNELAFTATRVGTDVPRALGPPGNLVTVFLRGGEDVTGETLGRFFAFHVSLLPLLLALVAALHVGLVQLQGMSLPPGWKREQVTELPFFPNILYRDLALWTVLLAVLATAAALLPPELGLKADPLAPTPAGLKPEWYFLFLFQTIKLFPAKLLFLTGESVAVALILLALALFFLLPFLDRRSSRGERSPGVTIAGMAALLYFLAMTLWGFLT